jgi:hypothetical protein
VKFTEREIDLNLPAGTCQFRPDGSGNYNNFIRTNPDGTVFLKLQDESGSVTVIQRDRHTWTGTGRVNVIWPEYRGDITTADWFEMTIVGTVSAGSQRATVTCKYRIANGVGVEAFVNLH